MRIWDINPGFLNDRSLLGEHCELHGIYSILTKDKTGYRLHPETKRWENNIRALIFRHHLLVEEMTLRGFNHKSELEDKQYGPIWPVSFIDEPAEQYRILEKKYLLKSAGRIDFPANAQELWAKHKYSVMARYYNLCKTIGKKVADHKINQDTLAEQLVRLLQQPVNSKALKNSIYHMWGYVSQYSDVKPDQLSLLDLLNEIRRLSLKHNVDYLIQSTALGELGYWCRREALQKAS